MPQTKAKGRKRPAGKKAKKTVKLEPKAEVVEEDVRAEEEEEETQQPKRKREKTEAEAEEDYVRSRHCPYLDTINRLVLDFDFEKLCSVSLSHLNVYACLVCGKYFQGRGKHSHAYTHSVQLSHHVFLNLHTLKFYCLPDNYEVIDPSLEDIKYVLNPTFSEEDITHLDDKKKTRALDGSTYLPGLVGLNNIKANDYMNVVLQALVHVLPLRNFFLREQNYSGIKRPPGDQTFMLVQRFGELFRKLWNPRNFKSHVSPHEMCQAVVKASKKQFQFIQQGNPIDFLQWLLNTLHRALGGTKKKGSSVIYKAFQGMMRVHSRKLPPPSENDDEYRRLLQQKEFQESSTETPFVFLTLDLPPAPLFQDEFEKNIIPQVPLIDLLAKFDGTTQREYQTYKDSYMKRFELVELPPYLILCIRRFTKNSFFVEKNPTIVNFPLEIDMAEYLSSDPAVQDRYPHTTYRLVANIVHDGKPKPGQGTYRTHNRHPGTGQWFELQDLHVTDLLPQMITLTESLIQFYELKVDEAEVSAS
ncbi:ubiquitin carboxyl-terminal hydrolase 39-like [Oscarella lobularis]|uniref:ubiquitin carboxyl-terminal hydrolase 39-like n=1 Tax=Oscarella lobularis TaxID=121494 RepID=UPI00331420DD